MQPRPRALRASHPRVPHGYHRKPGLMGVIDGPLTVTALAAAARWTFARARLPAALSTLSLS